MSDRPGDTGAGEGTITWRQLWDETARVVGGRTPARWLCEVASGTDGDEFRGVLDEPATERMVAHLDAMLDRWRAGEPLQYVLGRWAFRHLDLLVDRRVLIPRPETEQVVDVALAAVADRRDPLVVVDLGTGSGAIGLALASELGARAESVWLTDASADALDVARANTSGIGRHAARVRVAAPGDWFDALPTELAGRIDLLVSNPPYVADDDERLEPIIRDWEPAPALFAGPDGLDAIRHIVASAPPWLAPAGVIVLEIGDGQGTAAAALLRSAGFGDVMVLPDLAGRDRVVLGRMPAGPPEAPA